jgi:TolB-like protein
VAAAYVVGAWIVLQVAVALQTAMSLAASFSGAILALLVIGFPIALALSWFFEVTPEGIRRTLPAGEGALVKPRTTDLILAGALALVVIVATAQLLMPGASAPSATTTAPATPTAAAEKPRVESPALGDKSIAVLPFANLSTDEDDAVFADGLTEEVLNVVAQMRELNVISRTSASAFKGKATPLPEIARQLGVRHILEGSVRRDGEDIRVTAQLIDVSSDTHLWSETFDRDVDNVFALQEQIAGAIANALDVEISLTAAARRPLTANLDAYRLFLEGRERFRLRRTPQDLMDSVALYKRAIELDPKFAEAYSALALTYNALVTTFPLKLAEIAPLEQAAAEVAIQLKPSLAHPHAVLADLAKSQLKWETMREESAKALALDPSDPLALYVRGTLMVHTGHLDEGARLIDDARRRDPLYVFMMTGAHGAALARGDEKAALAIARKLARSGTTAAILGEASLAADAMKRADRAAAEMHARKAAKLVGGELSPAIIAAIRSPESLPISVKAINREIDEDPTLSPWVLEVVGAREQFLERLILEIERGNTARVTQMFGAAWPAARDEALRATFNKLARKMGLVDYWKKHGWPDRCRPTAGDDFECS